MDDSPIQRIKEKLDIVEVVGSYLKLQKTGINYRSLCPFHSEKKPSFFVSPARQTFKCFGCGVGGSIFDFVMKIEGLEFGDALRVLAQRAGVELRPMRPELRTQRQRLYEICELACRFFEKQLKESGTGKEVEKYLLKRGISEASIKKWRLGYSPETWRGLSDFLVSRGYKREEIVKAGLAVESEKSQTPYDRFRGRIMFPIFDFNSQVIGFGGRITERQEKEEETVKYINTPNTLLYDKGRVLYGLNFGKLAIRKQNFVILVEGYIDVILSHQAGFQNTVASGGTALTVPQLKILKRHTANLLTSFDSDVAGDLATQKGIDLAQKEDFEVKVIVMPQDRDPADIISKNPKKWQELVAGAKEMMEFYFESAFAKFNKEKAGGKKEIAQVLLPLIKRIGNKIVQSHFLARLAKELKVAEEAVMTELKKLSEPKKKIERLDEERTLAKKEEIEKSRKEVLEERVFCLALKSPKALEIISEDLFSFFSSRGQEILKQLKQEKGDFKAVLAKLQSKDPQGLGGFLDSLALRAEIEDEDEPEKELKLCLKELKRLFWKERLDELSKEIARTEEDGNQKKIKKLIEEFQEISRNLINT